MGDHIVSTRQVNGAVYGAIGAATRMLAAMGVDKSSTNESQGFNFRGIDAVLGAMSRVLVECQLFVRPCVVDHKLEVITDPKTGKLKFRAAVLVSYTITAAVDGSEVHTQVCAEALDSQDKATSKALSMAYKYFAFQTFCIPLEGVLDDADADSPMSSREEPVAQEEAPVEKPKRTPRKAAKEEAPAAAQPAETPGVQVQSEDEQSKALLAGLAGIGTGDAEKLQQLRGQLLGYRGQAVFAALKTAYKEAQARVETKA